MTWHPAIIKTNTGTAVNSFIDYLVFRNISIFEYLIDDMVLKYTSMPGHLMI